jgi:hypothetical protein
MLCYAISCYFSSFNNYLKCPYNRIKSKCNADVAHEEIKIIAWMVQPVFDALQLVNPKPDAFLQTRVSGFRFKNRVKNRVSGLHFSLTKI